MCNDFIGIHVRLRAEPVCHTTNGNGHPFLYDDITGRRHNGAANIFVEQPAVDIHACGTNFDDAQRPDQGRGVFLHQC